MRDVQRQVYAVNILAWAILVFVSTSLLPSRAHAQSQYGAEIKPFGWTSSDASFAVRYFLDEQETNPGINGSFEDRVTWEEELRIRTLSYVYHPGFLNFDFEIAPKLIQQDFRSTAGAQDARESFLGIKARLNFLQVKSYPVSVFFERSNPFVTTGLAGRYISEQERYGALARMRLFDKVHLRFDQTHLDISGAGFDRIEDESIDRFTLNAETGYGHSSTIVLNQSHEVRDSMSGSPNLPIQPSTVRNNYLNLSSTHYADDRGRATIKQVFRHRAEEVIQVSTTESDEVGYSARFQLDPSVNLSSALDLGFDEITQRGSPTKLGRVTASFDHALANSLRYGFRAGYSSDRRVDFESKRPSISGHVLYSIPTALGDIRFGGTADRARTDQVSTAGTIPVFGEAIGLVGTAPVELIQAFVVASSVVVNNDSRTQQYLEGLDYRLVVIGSVTSIQRLLGGNIQDGELVLVDYEFQTSGTAVFDSNGYTAFANMNFLRLINASVEYRSLRTNVLEGQLTTPKNDKESIRVALGADVFSWKGWRFAGNYSYDDRNEDITSSTTHAISISAMKTFGRATRLNLSGSLLNVDLEGSTENVDQMQYSLRLERNFWSRIQLGYNFDYLADDGGSQDRREYRHGLSMHWNYRLVRLDVRAGFRDESIGPSRRTSSSVMATLLRTF